jgi:N-terminal domain of anti-restriction factor ArdC
LTSTTPLRRPEISLANQLLIAMQKPEATRVAGFRAWLKLGYCVRKGESALRIWCDGAILHAKR